MTHFRRAGVLEALGRTREALDAGAEALARDPENIGALQWLAGARLRAERFAAAAGDLRPPDRPGAVPARVLAGARPCPPRAGRPGESPGGPAPGGNAWRLTGGKPAHRLRAELRKTGANGNGD